MVWDAEALQAAHLPQVRQDVLGELWNTVLWDQDRQGKVVQALKMVGERGSMRGAAKAMGVDKHTASEQGFRAC